MHFSSEPLAPPAPAHPGGGGADSGSCFVPPGGLPTEPTLRAHVMRMRSLRPGLHMHSDDTREPRDMVARTVLAPTQLPVGVVTLCVGGAYLVWLLASQGKRNR